jgi:hypothetical protein
MVDPVYRQGVLMAVGYTEADAKAMVVSSMSSEKFLEAITNSPMRKGTGAGRVAQAAPRQRTIPEPELDEYLAKGWIANMPVNGRGSSSSACRTGATTASVD